MISPGNCSWPTLPIRLHPARLRSQESGPRIGPGRVGGAWEASSRPTVGKRKRGLVHSFWHSVNQISAALPLSPRLAPAPALRGECVTPPCAPRTHFRAQARRDVRRRAGKYARAEWRSGPLRAQGLVVFHPTSQPPDGGRAGWGPQGSAVVGPCPEPAPVSAATPD